MSTELEHTAAHATGARRNLDLGSVLGLSIAIAGIALAQLIGGGTLGSLLQVAAFLIVVCGTFGAVMLQTRLAVFVQGLRMVRWVFMPPVPRARDIIEVLRRWARAARKGGYLALEPELEAIEDDFVRGALHMLVDGWSPERIRATLEAEIDAYEERLRAGAGVWEAAGGYAPTLGILGAVLGLMHVMQNMSDPTQLGAGVAVAFVATVYGIGLANLVFLPAASKLRALVDAQVRERELVLEGLIAVMQGENPKVLELRLAGYLG